MLELFHKIHFHLSYVGHLMPLTVPIKVICDLPAAGSPISACAPPALLPFGEHFAFFMRGLLNVIVFDQVQVPVLKAES